MAGIKISNLPAIVTPALTDVFPVVQSGVTYKETITQLSTLLGMSGGILDLAHGGTNANLTAVNGGIVYSNATALAISAAGSAGQILRSAGAATPVWSTSTFPATGGAAGNILISDGTNYISSTSLWPNTVGTAGKILRSDGTTNAYSTSTFADTYAINTILYNASANTVSGLATANSATLITSAGGVPSLSQTLPSAVQTNITALGAQSQALNMNTHLINGVVDPVSAQDAATKNYVDQTALNGTSVYAASTTNLTVTQSGAGVGATLTNAGAQVTFALDGVNPPVGSNVLIKNLAAAANEGIYTVTSVGSGASNWILTRATTYDTAAEINRTGLIVILNGSTLVGTAWYNAATIVTVDTTAFSYSQFGNINFPVTFAQGGTGAALTASNGGILYSNATTGAILAGTATAGLALLSGASTTPSWSTAPPITKVIIQTFAAGSSTYTPTTGMKFCTVEIVGGGGSGGAVSGGTAGQSAAGGGGGGGGYCRKTYTAVLIGATAAVVVGAGGALAAAGNTNGNTGGASTFTPTGAGVVLTANGGVLGTGCAKSAAAQNIAGGVGGTATNGDLNIKGQEAGTGATQAAAALACAGSGGSSHFGFGGSGLFDTVATTRSSGRAPVGFGAGSSGAADTGSADTASNVATDGICYITEYISV